MKLNCRDCSKFLGTVVFAIAGVHDSIGLHFPRDCPVFYGEPFSLALKNYGRIVAEGAFLLALALAATQFKRDSNAREEFRSSFFMRCAHSQR